MLIFWRPQKTASSTILSLLITYIYRHSYSHIPQITSSSSSSSSNSSSNMLYELRLNGARNGICHRLASCSDHYLQYYQDASHVHHDINTNNHNNDQNNNQNNNVLYMTPWSSALSRYWQPLPAFELEKEYRIERHHAGILSSLQSSVEASSLSPSLAASIQSFLSTGLAYNAIVEHQFCNLPNELIEKSLECAFSRETFDELHALKKHHGRKHQQNHPRVELNQHHQQNYLQMHMHGNAPREILQRRVLSNDEKNGFYHHQSISERRKKYNISSSTVHDNVTLQLFSVRDPLSRIISSYYYWGELMTRNMLRRSRARAIQALQQGESKASNELKRGSNIRGGPAWYHGNESTAPPMEFAMRFAEQPRMRAGMHPGPTFTWSIFSNSVADAIHALGSNRICTLVQDRLDESLVVAGRYLGWSLADMVGVASRKIASNHPSAKQWPQQAIVRLKQYLQQQGEYEVYQAAISNLDRRIASLTATAIPTISITSSSPGFNVSFEVELLRVLRHRATQVCMKSEYLETYRQHLQATMPEYSLPNRMNDVDQHWFDDGHVFQVGDEMMITYDLCAVCEAHALLKSAQDMRISVDRINESPSLADFIARAKHLFAWHPADISSHEIFNKCPRFLVPMSV